MTWWKVSEAARPFNRLFLVLYFLAFSVGLGYAELRRGSRLPEFKCFASTPPMRQMHVRAEPLQRADRRCTGSGVASSTNPGASPARGHHCCQPINLIC